MLTHAYFLPNPNDIDTRSREDATIAIVNRRTFAIDPYAWNTGDLTFGHGHWYSNKAPGESRLDVPLLLGLKGGMALAGKGDSVVPMGRRTAGGEALLLYYLLMWMVTVALVILRVVTFLGLYFWFLGYFSASVAHRTVLTLAPGLGTTMLAYAHNLDSHAPPAAAGFTGFVPVFLLAHHHSGPGPRVRLLLQHLLSAAAGAGGPLGLGVLLECPAASRNRHGRRATPGRPGKIRGSR